MPQNIILCSDGTGNSTIKNRGTNVYKIYEAMDLQTPPGEDPQVGFYDDGVGTGSLKTVRALGGAFGFGFARNIRQLYTYLCRVYHPGDRIYLFGFSRGAYTVRALAGMVGTCGILDGDRLSEPELRRMVGAAYDVYRLGYRPERWHADATRRAAEFRRTHPVYEPGNPVRIAFIGVWDTVGAVGLPDDAALKRVLWVLSGFRIPWFKNNRLGEIVDRACHALAIDEERQSFHPVLWDEPDNRLEQVWFPGVHSNIGGGYVKQGMSLVTFSWMMRHARAAKLRFSALDNQMYYERQNVHDKLYDSRAGIGSFYRYSPRNISALCRKYGIERPRVHASAFDRVGLRTAGYAPGNIPANSVVVGPGFDPMRLAKLQTAVQTTLPASLPLNAARKLMRGRQVAYFLSVGCVGVAALAAVVPGLVTDFGATATAAVSVSGLAGLAKDAVVGSPKLYAWLGAGAVTGWIWSAVARRRMADRFAAVWRSGLPDLRPIS